MNVRGRPRTESMRQKSYSLIISRPVTVSLQLSGSICGYAARKFFPKMTVHFLDSHIHSLVRQSLHALNKSPTATTALGSRRHLSAIKALIGLVIASSSSMVWVEDVWLNKIPPASAIWQDLAKPITKCPEAPLAVD